MQELLKFYVSFASADMKFPHRFSLFSNERTEEKVYVRIVIAIVVILRNNP